jgi:outer membrane protein insertion porin family
MESCLVLASRAILFAVVSAFLATTEPTRGAAGGSVRQSPAVGIEVVGARSVAPETVRAQAALPADRPPTDAETDLAIRSLMATGQFSDVRIDRRGNRVIVTVAEIPRIASISITGNAAIETSKLEAEVELKPRSYLAPARLQADARRIRDAYRRAGRLATEVQPEAKPRADGLVDVVFAVKEAPVSRIHRIAFTGNRAFSEGQLKDVMTTSESGWLDILKTAPFYDAERIETDRERIRRHYADNGYPDARIGEAEVVTDAQGTGYTITFAVEEGPLVRFGEAAVDTGGAAVVPEQARLADAIKLKPGATYSRTAVERTATAISERLSNAGKPFARVTPVERVGEDGSTIDVAFRVDEVPPLYAERIEITGNVRTKDHVIRRELRLVEGDALNGYILDRARARVMALGFFRNVAVKPSRGSAPDRATVTVHVEEQPTGEFSIGAGYSTAEGIIGDIGVGERNLFGNGQSLRLKLAGSMSRFQAEVSFTEPRFLGSNVAAGFDLFYKDVDYTKHASFMSNRVGGTVRLAAPIDENWSTGVNYTFARNTLYNVGATASPAIKEAIPNYPHATSTTYDTSSVGYSLAYDTRDNKRRAGSGVYYSLAQDFAGVGGDVRFIRNAGEARAYYTVAEGVTAIGRVTGGHITGWGGQDVRLLDLFYKGGETVRGFAPAGFGPRDTFSANADALGGRMFLATTAELQFDLPGVSKDLGLRGAVFADAGSLWGTNQTASALPGVSGAAPALRASAGVGLAWDSPIGPLRVDYAVPLVKQPYDKTQPLSFGLMPY